MAQSNAAFLYEALRKLDPKGAALRDPKLSFERLLALLSSDPAFAGVQQRELALLVRLLSKVAHHHDLGTFEGVLKGEAIPPLPLSPQELEQTHGGALMRDWGVTATSWPWDWWDSGCYYPAGY